MISESLLTRGECAACRECCVFESYDLYDTPTVTDEVMERARTIDPSVRFAETEGRRLFMMKGGADSELRFCPMLDPERGCRLGEHKPFECAVFPFRLMELDGRRAVTVSPVCPVVRGKPFGALLGEAKRLAPLMFAEADRCPQMIRKYAPGYPVLLIEEPIRSDRL